MYDAAPLLKFLNDRRIAYRVEHHMPTATAMETAQVEHVSGKQFAKSVVVKHGKEMFLAVLPAHRQIDIKRLEAVSKKKSLSLATEKEFADLFPNCDVGAMPPFGSMYSLDVYIDIDIATCPELTFNACSHEHTVTVAGRDFLKAAEGVVASFTQEGTEKPDYAG
jgi:Ala-tRNA(Pro) deacylase